MNAIQKEPIEETMWRTIKILRVFDKGSLHRHVNMTHTHAPHNAYRAM